MQQMPSPPIAERASEALEGGGHRANVFAWQPGYAVTNRALFLSLRQDFPLATLLSDINCATYMLDPQKTVEREALLKRDP